LKAPELQLGQVTALSRTLSCCPDPVALYAATCLGRCDTLLLESAEHATASGEKSLLVTRAALRLRCRGQTVVATALSPNGRSLLPWLAQRLDGRAEQQQRDDELTFVFPTPTAGRSEHERLTSPSVLDVVRAAMLDLQVVGGDVALPPLCAGSFGYDLLSCYEQLPAAKSDPTGWPDYELLVAEQLVWIQHASRKCTVLGYTFGGEHAEVAYHDATRALATTVAACEATIAPFDHDGANPADVACDTSDEAYCACVRELKQHIVQGDVFQIVPSRTFSLACHDALAAYGRLRKLNPSPYMFYLATEAGTLFGASPESALTVDHDRRVYINPIAGTRHRGRNAAGDIDHDLDGRIEAELRLDD